MVAPVLVLLGVSLCAAAPRAPGVVLAPRTPFATALPGVGGAVLTQGVLEVVEWQQGDGRGRLRVGVRLGAAGAAAGVEGAADGWLRAVDEAGLTHVLSSPLGWPAQAGPETLAVFQGDVLGAPKRLTLLVGSARRFDLALRLDLVRGTWAAAKIPAQLPVPAWPALESLSLTLLRQGKTLPLFPRATLAFPEARLRDVTLLVPAVQLIPGAPGRKPRLAVVRVFLNRGREAAREVPRDVWYSADGGEVGQPAQAFLAAAPVFGAYLDVVEVELPDEPGRGHLYLGHLGASGTVEILGQLRLDAKRRLAHPVREVEGQVVDAQDGRPLSGVEVRLQGSTDWRPDRSVALSVRTADDGRFHFARVEPGTYQLQAKRDSYLREERRFAQGSEPTRFELRLGVVVPPAGYIGVRLQQREPGIFVESVMLHSGAERAGLRAGDQVVAVDGQRVQSIAQAHEIIPGAPRTRVRLRVRREGRLMDLEATRTKRLPGGANDPDE